MAICGSEGLCTIVRAVCNSIASPLPEQRVVEVETGLYEGAAGSTPVCDLVDWIFCVEVGCSTVYWRVRLLAVVTTRASSCLLCFCQ